MLRPQKQTGLERGEKYLKKSPVFNITGGLDFRYPTIEIQDQYWSNAKNVYVVDKKVRKRPGYSTFGDNLPLLGTVVGFDNFFGYNGTSYLFCYTTRNAYLYNTSTENWEIVTANTEIQDCEDKDDWTASANVTLTDDTVYRIKGTNCLKAVIAAGFVTGIAFYDDFAALNLTAATQVHFWIRSTVALAEGDLQILLDDTGGCVSPLETIDIPALVAGTRTEISIDITTPAALGAVISLALNVAVDKGANTVYIDDVRGITELTGDVENLIFSDMIYNDTDAVLNFVFSNRVNEIQKFVPGVSSCFEDLGGSPNKAEVVLNFSNHLVRMDTVVTGTRFPQRVEWSVLGDPEDNTGSGSGNNALSKSSGWIKGAVLLKNVVAILKERSIVLMNYVGGTNPFEFEESRIVDIGTIAGKTAVVVKGEQLLFFANDLRMYAFDGLTCEPISSFIDTKLSDLLNPSTLDQCHATEIAALNLYLLFVPSVSSDYPNIVWCFNYKDNVFSYWEFNDYITATGTFSSYSATTIGELLATLGTLDWRIGSRELQTSSPTILFGSSDGYIYSLLDTIANDNGVAIDAWFDTKSFLFNDVGMYTGWEFISIYGSGDSVDISISMNGAITWDAKGTIELHKSILRNNIMVGLRAVSEHAIFRLQNSTLDENFEIAGIQIGHINKTEIMKDDVFGATHIGGPSDTSKYMLKEVYDADEDGVVDETELIDGGEW